MRQSLEQQLDLLRRNWRELVALREEARELRGQLASRRPRAAPGQGVSAGAAKHTILRYHIDHRGASLEEAGRSYLLIGCDGDAVLPEMELVACAGRAPINRRDGEIVLRISAGTRPFPREQRFVLPVGGQKSGARNFVRLFFCDDREYDRFRILSPPTDALRLD